MPASYSSKPLSEKLGLKAGLAVSVIDAPRDYRIILGHIPAGVLFMSHDAGELDFAHRTHLPGSARRPG